MGKNNTGGCRSLLTMIIAAGMYAAAWCQSPNITVRLANPQSDCGNQEYCLDVEFTSSLPAQELFGMNVRFFYNDETLELIDFRDFQGGYDAVDPDPPIINTSESAGPALFNFDGPADFVNGAIQLVNTGAPDILLAPNVWTKIFQICFTVDDQSANNLDTFCPPIVWDLEQNPANGGFLSGDDGVVMTVLDANGQSAPADESVVQFNWEYTGNGDPPYGQPVEIICSNVNCLLPLRWISFSGLPVAGGHLLTWYTANEYQVDKYDVEQSPNGVDWRIIGQYQAQAQGSSIQVYTHLDEVPLTGYVYYRIKGNDIDGAYAYSPILRQHQEGENIPVTLQVYPNPASSGYIKIRQPELSLEGADVYIFNAAGQVVLHSTALHDEYETDISTLARGVYLIHIRAPYLNTCHTLVIY